MVGLLDDANRRRKELIGDTKLLECWQNVHGFAVLQQLGHDVRARCVVKKRKGSRTGKQLHLLVQVCLRDIVGLKGRALVRLGVLGRNGA
jgi:hypothetical protein